MDQCQKESQRHGYCSKHLSQMREPNAFSQHIQRFVGPIGNLHPVAALPFLAEFYQHRFDYGTIQPPPPLPLPSFYHPMVQVPPPPSGLDTMASLRTYSAPTSPKTVLVNNNQSSSAFAPLLPIARQHSVDITPPPSSSSSVISNKTNSSIRRTSEDDDSEVDIETLPSPSKMKIKNKFKTKTKLFSFSLDSKRFRFDNNENDKYTNTNKES